MLYKERLKSLRMEANLTQQEVANILKIPRGLFSQYETEYTIIPIKHLITLADYFQVSLDYLFNFTLQKSYKDSRPGSNKINSGKNLKAWRKSQKLTQEKLAQELVTFQPVIADYERGRNLIATPFLYSICKKYNVSADYLLGKTNTLCK